MTQGKFKGLENGRTLLPPMPRQGYQRMNEEELKAIFKYLKTIKPVENILTSPIPPNEIE